MTDSVLMARLADVLDRFDPVPAGIGLAVLAGGGFGAAPDDQGSPADDLDQPGQTSATSGTWLITTLARLDPLPMGLGLTAVRAGWGWRGE